MQPTALTPLFVDSARALYASFCFRFVSCCDEHALTTVFAFCQLHYNETEPAVQSHPNITVPFSALVLSSHFVLTDTVVVTAVLPSLSSGIGPALVHTRVCKDDQEQLEIIDNTCQ